MQIDIHIDREEIPSHPSYILACITKTNKQTKKAENTEDISLNVIAEVQLQWLYLQRIQWIICKLTTNILKVLCCIVIFSVPLFLLTCSRSTPIT